MIGAVFGIPNVIVAPAQYESASLYPYLWGKNVIVAYVDPNPGIDVVTFGGTFSTEAGETVRRYRNEERGGGSDVIEAWWDYDYEVICQDCGALIKDAIS